MSPFEYVIVLISIVLGMGIAQIVTGVADLVQHWDRVKVYWPHLLWLVIIFFLHIQDWWSTYELRHFTTFRLPTFIFILSYPINLFILARIIFPAWRSDTDFDLRRFYFANYKKIMGWITPLVGLAFLQNVFVAGYALSSQFIQIGFFILFIILTSLKSLPEIVHKILPAVLVLFMLGVLIFMWNDPLTIG